MEGVFAEGRAHASRSEVGPDNARSFAQEIPAWLDQNLRITDTAKACVEAIHALRACPAQPNIYCLTGSYPDRVVESPFVTAWFNTVLERLSCPAERPSGSYHHPVPSPQRHSMFASRGLSLGAGAFRACGSRRCLRIFS